jgi:hypothetical protein
MVSVLASSEVDSRGMSGCFTMASPTLGPKPNTKFTTPGGNPEKKFRCSQTP